MMTEQQLATELDIPIATLRKWRNTHGPDDEIWKRDGKEILYTEAGRAAVYASNDLPLPPALDTLEKKSAPTVFWVRPWRDSKIRGIARDHEGRQVVLQVHDSRAFREGQEVKAEYMGDDTYISLEKPRRR
jgi:hypothetical protein